MMRPRLPVPFDPTPPEGLCAMARMEEPAERRLRRFFLERMGIELPPHPHLTLMHHAEPWPEGMELAAARSLLPESFEGILTGVASWQAEPARAGGARSFLVALVESPQAQRAHDGLRSLGLSHSFGEFRPHVTIARSVAENAFGDEFVRGYDRFLSRARPYATFGEVSMAGSPALQIARPAEPEPSRSRPLGRRRM